jgi:hypothetical protein
MSNYIIASERLGVVGQPFTPDEDTNVEALLAGGFITLSGAKSDKTNAEPQEEN